MRKKREVISPPGPSTSYVVLTRGLFALIDSADAPDMAKHNWNAQWNRTANSFYAARKKSRGTGHVWMHREIAGAGIGQVADHINSISLDNRRCNLRPATAKQNSANRRGSSRSRSGLKGAAWNAGIERWQSYIGPKYLGVFATPEEAHACYAKAAEAKYGEFARSK